jgi:glycosyltransferase involved in cell wall biosynthesis
MNAELQPLVSVVTPIYNGADHLAECIESILGQTYRNLDFVIVNNCSTDESLAIAQKYAAQDPRIRIVNNDRFLKIIENHNHAFRQISPQSKYCKLVFGDDWLYPTCIEEMVRVAEDYPSVGLVSAYTTDGQTVLNTSPICTSAAFQGLPHPACKVSGKDVCRGELLGAHYVFGTMTALLVRSEQVHKRPMFLHEPHLHADLEVCLDILRDSDFGFAQQVLSCSRPREQSTSTFATDFDVLILGHYAVFLKYGHDFLNNAEYMKARQRIRAKYYRVLACNVLRMRQKEYWKYHRDTLAAYGERIDRGLLAASVITEAAWRLSHPFRYFKKGWLWWSKALHRVSPVSPRAGV